MHFLTTLLCVLARSACGSRIRFNLGSDLGSHPERWITYGFRATGATPTMIDSTKPLFSDKFAEKIPYPTVTGESQTYESERELANKVASETGIDGSYGAFSASAKVSTENINNEKVKKMRWDRTTTAYKYKV